MKWVGLASGKINEKIYKPSYSFNKISNFNNKNSKSIQQVNK